MGKAYEQTFAAPLQQQKECLSEENDVTICLGRLMDEDDLSVEECGEVLSDTEALLIYRHSPPYNSQHFIDFAGQDLNVHNWGNRSSVLPECSTDYWQAAQPRDEW